MIIDTSALIAVARNEEGHEQMTDALLSEAGLVPSVVVHEFRRVMALEGNRSDPDAEALLSELQRSGVNIEPFTSDDANLAAEANPFFGTGNGRGGRLNFVDLMVYGMAKRTSRPILCVGKDFVATDIPIHPASRQW